MFLNPRNIKKKTLKENRRGPFEGWTHDLGVISTTLSLLLS